MNQALLEEVISHPDSSLLRFTVDQYQRLLDDGVVADGSQYELLDGYIFHKNRADVGADEMIHSPRHSRRLAKLTPILNQAAHDLEIELYCQLPLQIDPHSAPEPDFSFVIPFPETADDRHPGPSDVCLVVEVALSSLKRDREGKLPIYARAGVPEYWILNLADRQLEVYSKPDRLNGCFQAQVIVQPGNQVTITGPNGKSIELSVTDLL
jgi:Uma2 family endonuclease